MECVFHHLRVVIVCCVPYNLVKCTLFRWRPKTNRWGFCLSQSVYLSHSCVFCFKLCKKNEKNKTKYCYLQKPKSKYLSQNVNAITQNSSLLWTLKGKLLGSPLLYIPQRSCTAKQSTPHCHLIHFA